MKKASGGAIRNERSEIASVSAKSKLGRKEVEQSKSVQRQSKVVVPKGVFNRTPLIPGAALKKGGSAPKCNC